MRFCCGPCVFHINSVQVVVGQRDVNSDFRTESIMESAMKGRAKRRHLGASECVNLSNSVEGSRALTDPFSTSSSMCQSRAHLGQTKKARTAVHRVSPQKLPSPRSHVDAVDAPQDEDDFSYIPDELLRDVSNYEDAEPVEAGGDSPHDVHYGLLGGEEVGVGSRGHVEELPDELLRAVLSHLPAEDLYRCASLVCHRWRDVTHDALFVPWKKLYYRYQMRERGAVQTVSNLLQENSMTQRDDLCVLNMLRYMSRYKHGVGVRPEEVLRCVRAHRVFTRALACLRHRLPELVAADEAPNPWSVAALILLLADGVKDVLDLVSCLSGPAGPLSRSEACEFLSCVATVLLAMRHSGVNISNRWHYNVFYVLHLLEKTSVPSQGHHCRTEQSGRGPAFHFQPTHEQQQILCHNVCADHVVKIMAFAGTGKTSTLVAYAQLRPGLRFLYVAFNRSVANEARRTFPANVDCQTVHGMAFNSVGLRYKMLKKLTNNIRPLSVAWSLPQGYGGYVNAKVVTQTINAFFASADGRIGVAHVPSEYKNTIGQNKRPDHTEKLAFANIAQGIWEKMQELTSTRESAHYMTHDGYLKLWQLQRPELQGYDVIFIDEAQDCNPAILDIMLSQNCGKILVGDPNQQIYTFRGAINALHTTSHTHLYYLTQSFRFGPEIAYVGATVLDVCKNVKKILVGGNQEGSVIGEKDESYIFRSLSWDGADRRRRNRTAILSRCNATVFDSAVRLTDSPIQPRLHIVGGADNFGLKTILDIWVLMQPEDERMKRHLAIKDSFIRSFCRHSLGGYTGLRVYATNTEDRELEGKLAVVEKYRNRIPDLVNRIMTCSVSDQQQADVILGTVHKSKGLEFDTVIVMDDFVKVPCAQHLFRRFGYSFGANVPEDEWNLLYVAVTRARRRLVITKTLENILTVAGEYFLRPVLTESLLGQESPPQCSIRNCHNRVRAESPLTMCKLPIKYLDCEHAGGPLCVTCVEQRLGHSAYLLDCPQLVKATPYTEEQVDLAIYIERMVVPL